MSVFLKERVGIANRIVMKGFLIPYINDASHFQVFIGLLVMLANRISSDYVGLLDKF